ncbi:MAG: putative Ig domain-containing protein [Verrucomicrobia bacterium]|nr:putative Ig domain-containing protein [Verrucomicrobiota bacterium]
MCRFVFAFYFAFLSASALRAQSADGILRMRFQDSQTGYAIQPSVAISGLKDGKILPVPIDASGRAHILLPEGDYTIAITSDSHQSFASAVAIKASTPPLQFSLDPLLRPAPLNPENIVPLRRPDATVFVGYVVNEESGQPIENLNVFSEPSGIETLTDAYGFFRIYVPLQSDAEWRSLPAKLLFAKDGFVTEEHQSLQVGSNSDWILRIQMASGSGTNVLNQGGKRIKFGPFPKGDSLEMQNKEIPVASAAGGDGPTIRIPTNIRVLMTNGTIEYVSMETYTARSVSHEWFSSWGNYSGGMNSLKAGTVAVRSYAAWYVNSATSESDYDICATTSCQVYRTTSSSNGNAATSQTTGYVIVGSNNTISRSEYSAENNSAGFSCGDGFTQPTGGCIADPVCSGETRFGHGRGMCQWGTFKWATGLKVSGNGSSYPSNANSGITNGQPKQDWIWIVNHYYPNLRLIQAMPLVIGDAVKIVGASSRDVRMCGDGGISSGVNCTFIATKAVGSTGAITIGPVRVTSDGEGFTWWKVSWSDGQIGWIPENWLERVIPLPPAPTNLHAFAIATNQVNLTWSVDASDKLGYRIQRRPNPTATWVQIDDIPVGVTSYSDTTAQPSTTNYYRIRAYNLGGNSSFSNTTNAITPGIPPTLASISNRTVAEEANLTFTAIATAPDFITLLADFENYSDGDAVMFRNPIHSGSTSAHIGAGSSSAVSASFPTSAGTGTRVLKASWSFNTGTSNPWLRLTTSAAANLPNPVIDFTKKLRFDVRTDKTLKVALGCRETTNAVGTAIGSDGGSLGAIEFVGVNTGTQPNPIRTVVSNTWTTLTFDMPDEPVRSFSGGNHVLSTASGLGVLEHLAFVPNGGLGDYNVYLDNFVVAQSKILTFSLDPGAPAGATIHPSSGVFSWTPTEAQGPGSYPITVRVTDNAAPALSDSKTFTVTVTEVNTAPVLAVIANLTVHAGNSIVFTNFASDADIPANTLSFSLDPGAPLGSGIHPVNGVFSWTPNDSFVGSNNSITVRVTDSGSPQKSDARTFGISVVAKPSFEGINTDGENVTLSWSVISGRSYKVQYKSSLSDPVWTDIATVVASADTASRMEPIGTGQRYYRIVALD